jgi:spermidine/putrescine transport system permease protein
MPGVSAVSPPSVAPARRMLSRRTIAPYVLLAPGLLWLALFFIYPGIQMFLVSLWTGNAESGYDMTFNFGIYPSALGEYWPWILRSIEYGGLATILAFALGFPLAYMIAFRGGAYKNVLLFLVIAPFFTSFLLRTISWKIILADDGPVLGPLKQLGLIDPGFRLLSTPAAVVAGITYNFLPFMTLPLYVALEKIDKRLIEAAEDLYAGPWRPGGTIAGAVLGGVLGLLVGAIMEYPVPFFTLAGALLGAVIGTFLISQAFVRITLPLALPGIFAGSLLTFIPAVGDFINAELLGNPQSQMIGNVIQARYLQVVDYPTASALSFILMAAILIGVLIYSRLLGTEQLTGSGV